MMLEHAFGEILKQIRTEKNLSQDALAFASGLDRTFISMLERGKRQPTISSLFKISTALEISPSEFIALVEKKWSDSPFPEKPLRLKTPKDENS